MRTFIQLKAEVGVKWDHMNSKHSLRRHDKVSHTYVNNAIIMTVTQCLRKEGRVQY